MNKLVSLCASRSKSVESTLCEEALAGGLSSTLCRRVAEHCRSRGLQKPTACGCLEPMDNLHIFALSNSTVDSGEAQQKYIQLMMNSVHHSSNAAGPLNVFSDPDIVLANSRAVMQQFRPDVSPVLQRMLVPRSFHEELLNHTAGVFDQLHKSKIPFWLTGGGLLSVARHAGKLIPWDDDVDICVPKEFEKELQRAFSFPYGCEYVPLFGYKVYNRSFTSNLKFPFGQFVDIFLMEAEEEKGRWQQSHQLARSCWPQEWWTLDEVFPLKDENLKGGGKMIAAPTPHHIEGYLTRMYGDDWAKTAILPKDIHGRQLSQNVFLAAGTVLFT